MQALNETLFFNADFDNIILYDMIFCQGKKQRQCSAMKEFSEGETPVQPRQSHPSLV